MPTTVLVTPDYSESSTPLIKQCVGSDLVYSNYKLPIPHTFVKYASRELFGDKDLTLNPSTTTLNISEPFIKRIAIMTALSEKTDRILLVFPDNKTIHPLYIILAQKLTPRVRVIVGGQLLTNEQVTSILSKANKVKLKEQYENIFGKPKDKKRYLDHELTRTPNGATLRQYQQQMMDFVLKQKRCGLFVDMGLGKTLATLATINKLVMDGSINPKKPILIVAPIVVAVDTWAREADKWGYDMDVKINIKLTPKKRAALLDSLLVPQEKPTLVTTNPAQIDAIFDHYQQLGVPHPFEVVIVDELSMFKSATAKRFVRLSQETEFVKYFIGLTGTPAPNNLLDVWSQLILIDPQNKRSFGKNFFIYRDLYFEPDKVSFDRSKVYSWKLKPGAKHEIFRRMSKTVISMESQGLVDLPDITYSNLYVTLPPKIKKQYDELAELTLKELENFELELERSSVEIANPAVLKGRLCQLASGSIYESMGTEWEDGEKDIRPYTVFHDEKLKALKELVETATSPLLVFYYFQSDLDRLGDYIDYELLHPNSKNLQDIISRWNSGNIPVLALHPVSAAHGLNLQDGGHTIVWLTPTWSNEAYRQANKRLHRSGQKYPVSVIHIVAKGTADEDILQSINYNEAGQSELMKALDVAVRD